MVYWIGNRTKWWPRTTGKMNIIVFTLDKCVQMVEHVVIPLIVKFVAFADLWTSETDYSDGPNGKRQGNGACWILIVCELSRTTFSWLNQMHIYCGVLFSFLFFFNFHCIKTLENSSRGLCCPNNCTY